eukprot:8398536-Pyramimonas_sp.AAC.1
MSSRRSITARWPMSGAGWIMLACPCTYSTVYNDGIEVLEVRWDKCIRTGGPEGPLVFNLIVAAMWSSTVREWDVLGLGYRMEFVTGSTS